MTTGKLLKTIALAAILAPSLALAQYQPLDSGFRPLESGLRPVTADHQQPAIPARQQPATALPAGKILEPVLGGVGQAGAGGEVVARLDNALGALLVNWPQDSISLNQVQSLMLQAKGADKLRINFPNGANLNTNSKELAALQRAFAQQAQSLGFGNSGSLPGLIFTSMQNGTGMLAENMQNMAMIPVNAVGLNLESSLGSAMRELRYNQMAFADWLPDWVKGAALWVYNLFVGIYQVVAATLHDYFG